MDIPGSYSGGGHKQHISRKEIEIMKKNMKKVPIIQLKKEIYHTKELNEVENILENIPIHQSDSIILSSTTPIPSAGFASKIIGLRKHFISLFSLSYGKYGSHKK